MSELQQDSPETIKNLFADLAHREQEVQKMIENSRRPIFDKSTLIPVGFVISIVAAAMFFGSLVTVVDATEADVKDIKQTMSNLATKKDLNNAIKDLKEYVNK